MEIKKTHFCSLLLGREIPLGCKYCVNGEKLVLFVTGKCSRNCVYCSLSKNRKDKEIIFANELKCKSIKQIIQETKNQKALGAGITGGDPLICFNRTIKFIKELKKEFGKKFHIHIYLPTKLVNKDKLKKLFEAGVDEVRFHPNLYKFEKKDIEKIKLAKCHKWNVGIEIPAIPGLEKNIFKIIFSLKDTLDFLNLNELEISDTNFSYIQKIFRLNRDTYTIKNSNKSAVKIINFCKKLNINFPVHFCTARTKNLFQYRNRLKRYALNLKKPFHLLTQDYNFLFAELRDKNGKNVAKQVSMNSALKNKKTLKKKFRIFLIEQMPTSDRMIIQEQEI